MNDNLAERLAAAWGSACEVGALLARGGMDAVYRATDRRLPREVAVMRRRRRAATPRFRRREVTAWRPSTNRFPPKGAVRYVA